MRINPVDLELRLKRMELDFINGRPGEARPACSAASPVSRRELINFCFHLEQLTRAGVPILEGLTDLRDSLENPRFREVIAGMIESIDGGKTLSQAMARAPQRLRRRVRQPGARRREHRQPARGAEESRRIAEVAGRTGRADQEARSCTRPSWAPWSSPSCCS